MTSGEDLLVAAWRQLDPRERASSLASIRKLHERDLAGEDSEYETLLLSLRRAAEHLGETPSPDAYDRVRAELASSGSPLPPRSRIMRRFDSWRDAREAVELYATPSQFTSARRIEARFQTRQVGKVWRYTDDVLAGTMADAIRYVGRVPRIAEFDHWRHRELELRRSRGEKAPHLPSASPYRKRWGTWDDALIALGYEPSWIAERLDASALASKAAEAMDAATGRRARGAAGSGPTEPE